MSRLSTSTAPAVVVEEFTPMRRGTLLGFARIRMPSGLIFHDVTIHAKNDSAWASPASRAMVGSDGIARRDANGKIRYTPVVSFGSKELRDKFSRTITDAVRRSHPETFQ